MDEKKQGSGIAQDQQDRQEAKSLQKQIDDLKKQIDDHENIIADLKSRIFG